MDVEKTMQFILEGHAQTEAILRRTAEDQKRLKAIQVHISKDLLALKGIVGRVPEVQQRHEKQFQRREEELKRRREENEAFHREVDERFKAFIKMMEERIRNRRKGNAAS